MNVAEIAVISDNALATSILIDLYARFDNEYVLDFIRLYEEKGPIYAFDDFSVDYVLIEEFERVYSNKPAPTIAIVREDNKEELLKASKQMRTSIRGRDIGGLG